MRRFLTPNALVVLFLALGSLACVQTVPNSVPSTPTVPAASPTLPAPTVMPSPVPTEAESETATVRAALVNVRANPGGEVVGQLIAGQDVAVLGCVDSWCEVRTDELTGYVFQGCLSIADGQGCEAK